MNSQYTNIRYHIYRELAKYHKKQEQRRSAVINDFAIPVFSGVVAALAASLSSGIEFDNLSHEIFAKLAIPITAYILVLIIARPVVFFLESHIKPNVLFQIIRKKKDVDNRQEDLAAKFNYEVSYLVKAAYMLSKETNEDNWLMRLNTVEACFLISNALRKISESILITDVKVASTLISDNRVEVVMNMIHDSLINLVSRGSDFEDIEPLRRKYENYRELIEGLYEFKLPSISVPN